VYQDGINADIRRYATVRQWSPMITAETSLAPHPIAPASPPPPALASDSAAHPADVDAGRSSGRGRVAGRRAEPLRFVVDSAAGATLVDDRVVRRYGLEDADAEVSQAQGECSFRAVAAHAQHVLAAGQLAACRPAMKVDLSSLPKDDDPAIDGLIGNDLTGRWDTRGTSAAINWRCGHPAD
jgi:hypothetical protein